MRFSNHGLSLIEVLVAMGLISVLITAVTLVSLTLFRSWPTESEHTNQRLAASNAVERMLKDLRAGLEITQAEVNQITFWLDANDNGLKETPDEEVTLSWSGVVGKPLYRAEGGGLKQELLTNINNFLITYFAENNKELKFPIADPSLIRLLRLELSSQIDDELINLRFNVRLRNL